MQEELRDIHLPDPVSWWPPAPGWYGLFILAILFIALGLYLLWKWRHPSIKKLAQRELQKIEQSFSQHQNSQQLCSDVSILLRRVAMSYDARNRQAGITGKEWLSHLNNLCGQTLFDDNLAEYLLFAPYKSHSELPADKLITTSRQWITLLPRNKLRGTTS